MLNDRIKKSAGGRTSGGSLLSPDLALVLRLHGLAVDVNRAGVELVKKIKLRNVRCALRQ
jgi:hypothetical protein